MISQTLITLLQQIKVFLIKNKQIDGASALLSKLDQCLSNSTSSHLNTQNSEGSQVILQNYQVQSIQLIKSGNYQNTSIPSQKKCTYLIDVFALQYNMNDNCYQIVSLDYPKSPQSPHQDRLAIRQLLIGQLKQHFSQKQKTHSMTQLHQLTSNIPKNLPPLILPNSTNISIKYTYIYQTKQCLQRKNKYYLVDRFYCFITQELCTKDVNQIVKKVKGRVYQARVTHVQNPFDVNHKIVRKCFHDTFKMLIPEIKQTRLSIIQQNFSQWIKKQSHFRIHQINSSTYCSLLTLIVYLAISQSKIIFTVSKSLKHYLSDLVLSLQSSLTPLKYIYPVVFCSLTREHCDFVDSPVPLIVGFWGSERKRYMFARELAKSQLKYQKERGTITIAIDLQSYSIQTQTGITNQDVYIIDNFHKYIIEHGRGDTVQKKISNLIHELINEKYNKQQLYLKNQWVFKLKQKIWKSQMFQQIL